MAKTLLVLWLCCISTIAAAQEPEEADDTRDTVEAGQADDTVWTRDTLLGDLGGVRSRLAQAGVTVDLEDVHGAWINVSGGVHRAALYNGSSTLGVTIDLERAVQWEGAHAHVSFQWLRGRSPTHDLAGSLQTLSQTELGRTGVQDIWLEQDLLNRQISIRAGQEQVEEEFLNSPYGAVMLSSTFGWPGLADVNVPSSTPSPMIRIAFNPMDQVQLKAAAFSSNGISARGALVITELQYTRDLSSYRLGAWYRTGAFPDQVFETWTHRSAYSVYAGVDQMVWHKPDTEDQGVAIFARVLGGVHSLADLQVTSGISWKGAIQRREADTMALGVSYLRFSQDAQHQSALLAAEGEMRPLPRSETVLELTYQAQVTPWLQVQPDLQYIVHPAGQLDSSGRLPGNALLLAIQISVRF